MQAGRENKPHIGIYGRCNAGKSSLLNFITSSDASITSPVSGTTTDSVRRSYEIVDFAPVIFIDTAGYDDQSVLSSSRIDRMKETLSEIDLAVIVLRDEIYSQDSAFIKMLEDQAIPYVVIDNISDRASKIKSSDIAFSIPEGNDCDRDGLIELIKKRLPEYSYQNPSLLGGKVGRGDIVVLVTPIDSEAPKGRLILPQVQTIRDLLDNNAVSVILQPNELKDFLDKGISPRMVIADSQVLSQVAEIVPKGIELTSFSIILSQAKGDPETFKEGLKAVDNLKAGDRILVMESCLHQTSCEDIARVKIPRWLNEYTNAELQYDFVSGRGAIPSDLNNYSLILHCGGCMITRRQLLNRIRAAKKHNIPITNYGMLIRKITCKP